MNFLGITIDANILNMIIKIIGSIVALAVIFLVIHKDYHNRTTQTKKGRKENARFFLG